MSEDRDCAFAEYFSTNPLSCNWFDIVDPSSILSLPIINLLSPITSLTDRHAIKAACSEVAIYRKTEGIPADSHLENPEDGHRMPFIDLSACQLGDPLSQKFQKWGLAATDVAATGTRGSPRHRREVMFSPLFFYMKQNPHTSEISVFVDESGSFGPGDEFSRFYLLCMVFHDQSNGIGEELDSLQTALTSIGLPGNHCIHAGPLIRREREYSDMNREVRRTIFSKMLAFMRRVNVRYRCFAIDRKYNDREDAIHSQLLAQIASFVQNKNEELSAFDALKIYYDNGQRQVTALPKEAFRPLSPKVTFAPAVSPVSYRLFQFADVACTLELADFKLKTGLHLTPSEQTFFEGERNFRKNFLRTLRRKGGNES